MPCKHGGCCIYADVALAGSKGSAQAKEYQCACNPGYAGLFCDNVLSICAIGNPCQNGGTCQTIGQTGYRCRCKQPFRGRYCQTYWPEELQSAGTGRKGFPQLPNQGVKNPSTSATDHSQALSRFKSSLKFTLDEKLAKIDALLDRRAGRSEKAIMYLNLSMTIISEHFEILGSEK
ncbi:notch homolog 2 N-terminal-like protein A [Sycon ciliatum]|uniref:notch homolog 2 N-terminal-like protein A n=1 Tax=Sycon ciliatum TaxID=27933 RepID=UPI0031F6CF0A